MQDFLICGGEVFRETTGDTRLTGPVVGQVFCQGRWQWIRAEDDEQYIPWLFGMKEMRGVDVCGLDDPADGFGYGEYLRRRDCVFYGLDEGE